MSVISLLTDADGGRETDWLFLLFCAHLRVRVPRSLCVSVSFSGMQKMVMPGRKEVIMRRRRRMARMKKARRGRGLMGTSDCQDAGHLLWHGLLVVDLSLEAKRVDRPDSSPPYHPPLPSP